MAVLNVNIPEFYECFTGGIWEIVISPSYPMSHSGKFKCISNLTHSQLMCHSNYGREGELKW